MLYVYSVLSSEERSCVAASWGPRKTANMSKHEDAPEMCKRKEEMSHYPKSQRRTTKGPRHGAAEILLPRAEIYAFPSHRNKYEMFAN